jgi:hypothetical protein
MAFFTQNTRKVPFWSYFPPNITFLKSHSQNTYPCAEISRRCLLERCNPGDVSWIKLWEICTSEQKLEKVFTFRVAVYRPDDKTTKCFLSTGGNRRFPPLAQGYESTLKMGFWKIIFCQNLIFPRCVRSLSTITVMGAIKIYSWYLHFTLLTQKLPNFHDRRTNYTDVGRPRTYKIKHNSLDRNIGGNLTFWRFRRCV